MAADQVKCLILPLRGSVLIVPDAVVAEVLSDQVLKIPPISAPAWQLGQIEWRDECDLRVISFEGICGQKLPEALPKARVVVMHSIAAQQKSRYYAICIRNVPSFEIIDGEALKLLPNQSLNPDCVFSRVAINNTEGYVPDLDEIGRVVG